MVSSDLSFFLFVPAKLRDLDTLTKYQHVMKCCPACAGPLVLFHDKFGEVGRTEQETTGKGSPDGTSITEVAEEAPLPAAKTHGGWYCSDCGVHIVPDNKISRTSATTRQGLRHSSRSMEDLKVNTNISSAKKRSSSQPASPKSKTLVDDQYDEMEKQLRNSFMTLIGHIREHYSQKEAQLKEYQVDLCQRERILRANEEHLNQRINRLRQSEEAVRNKMERLSLYKSSMVSQLEAQNQQLSRWEQNLRQWEAKLRGQTPDWPAPDVGTHGFREPLGKSLTRSEQRPWNASVVSLKAATPVSSLPTRPYYHDVSHHNESQLSRQPSQSNIYDYPPNNQPISSTSQPRQQQSPRDVHFHQDSHKAQGPQRYFYQQVSQSQMPKQRHSLGYPDQLPNSHYRRAQSNQDDSVPHTRDDTINVSDLSMTNYMYTSYRHGPAAKPSPDSGYSGNTSANHTSSTSYPTGTGPPAYYQSAAMRSVPLSPRDQWSSNRHHRSKHKSPDSIRTSHASLHDASDHEMSYKTSPRMTYNINHSMDMEEYIDNQGRRVYRRVTEI